MVVELLTGCLLKTIVACIRFWRRGRRIGVRTSSFMPLLYLTWILTIIDFGALYFFRISHRPQKSLYALYSQIIASNFHYSLLCWNGIMIVLLILRGLAQIFFGGLRASEYEHLIEGTSLALTDTFLLIMILRSTIDRNITSPVFIMMIGKWTRWILRDRVDYIEGLANVPQSTAIKTTLVLFIVLITDSYCVIKYGLKLENFFTANLNSVFILEFFLGVVETVHLFFEYFLLAYDTMLEDPNFNKPLMQLYGNLIAVGSSLFAQTMFLLLLVKHMVFPIISLRTFTLNLRDFRKYLKNIVQSKRALKLMDTSFPDATIAEILENNTQCIICREELNNENDAAMNLEGPSGWKKLPCGHMMHTACLRNWFQRQQVCPLCRQNVFSSTTNSNHRAQRAGNEANNAVQNNNANHQRNNDDNQLAIAAQQVVENENNALNQHQEELRRLRRRNERSSRRHGGNSRNGEASTRTSSTSTPPSITAEMENLSFILKSISNQFLHSQSAYTISMPKMPENFAEISQEALEQLEKEMKTNIVARINHLNQIKRSIEITNVMMNSYNNVCSETQVSNSTPPPTSHENVVAPNNMNSSANDISNNEAPDFSGVLNEID